MTIAVTCKTCGTRLKAPDSAGGRKIRCPKCQNSIPVPAAEPEFVAFVDEQEPPHRLVTAAAVRRGIPRYVRWLAIVGGVFVLCGGLCLVGSHMRQKQLDDVAVADGLYEAGRHGEAVEKYKTDFEAVGKDRQGELIKRIVEQDVAAGDMADARKWIERGRKEELIISYDSPAAKDLLADVKRAEEARAAEEKARIAKAKADEEARKQEQLADVKKRKEIDAKHDKMGHEWEAKEQAIEFAKKKLSFPEEAKIKVLNAVDPATTETKDNAWLISGEGIGKNAFGVKIKFYWACRLKREEDEKSFWWTEIETIVTEE